MSEQVLVTGGAGFIGSHVVDECLRLGHRVIVLDDLSGGFTDHVNPRAQFVEGSILDRPLLDRLFRENEIKHIYHLAAYAAEGLSHFIRHFNYQNNLIGSVNLINQAVNHGVECFVFTSSIAVYGDQQVPMDETMTPAPEDPYGIAKFAVEQELRTCHEMFGLDYVIFRPHNVYGERQNIGDKYRNVIGIFMNQIMQGLPMTIFGDGTQSRAFSYIDSVAPLIARAPHRPDTHGQVFNVGADTPYTVNELAGAVARAMGVEPVIEHLEPRNEVKHAYCSHEKARRFFGEPEDLPLAEGLERMAAWARRVGARKSKDFEEIEIPRNLPPSWAAVAAGVTAGDECESHT